MELDKFKIYTRIMELYAIRAMRPKKEKLYKRGKWARITLALMLYSQNYPRIWQNAKDAYTLSVMESK